MTQAGEALQRALCADFDGLARVEALKSRSWASITFSGERHRLVLRIEGAGARAAADRFLDSLAEREFDLEGHILADIAPVADERDANGVRLSLEALTVEAD
jgi:hypothetical protein